MLWTRNSSGVGRSDICDKIRSRGVNDFAVHRDGMEDSSNHARLAVAIGSTMFGMLTRWTPPERSSDQETDGIGWFTRWMIPSLEAVRSLSQPSLLRTPSVEIR